MSTRVETIRARVGGTPIKLLVEYDSETGRPVDVVTAGHGKIGTQLDALWRCFVLCWRINFAHGVPTSALQTFVGRQDETAGPTGNERVPHAGGHADFFAQAIVAYAESLPVVEPVSVGDVEKAAGEAGGVA